MIARPRSSPTDRADLGGAGDPASSPADGGSASDGGTLPGPGPAPGPTCSGCQAPTPCVGCWQPALNTRWQYQLQPNSSFASTGGINASISAVPSSGGAATHPVAFDIDLFDESGTTPNTAGVDAIHAQGGKAICYVDAGTYENFRPDAASWVSFNSSCGGCLLGKTNGWPGEQWVNLNNDKGQRDFLFATMDARVARCKQAKFDAVEFDNVDGYSNATGYAISASTHLVFNSGLANIAHKYGLSAALKNDPAQVAGLLPYFDFTVNEQCFEFSECASLQPFVAAGKAVFNVEYNKSASSFCASASAMSFNSITKTLDLTDTPWVPCR